MLMLFVTLMVVVIEVFLMMLVIRLLMIMMMRTQGGSCKSCFQGIAHFLSVFTARKVPKIKSTGFLPFGVFCSQLE